MTIRPRRSVLFMPGNNARALDKARELAADGVIFDLEDAVAPDAKAATRDQIAAAVGQGGYAPREVVVRVNGPDGDWFADDVQAVAALAIDAVLVPKIETPGQVQQVVDAFDRAGGKPDLPVWVMVETPRGVLAVDAIAAAHPRLKVIVVGLEDLAKDARIRPRPDRLGFLYALSRCVLAARADGLDVLDAVYPDFNDAAGFAAVCEQGRDLGFDGKTLIHPKQIETANRVFAPDAAAVGQARRLLAAWDEARAQGKGIAVLDGRMVEHLHVAEARRTLALAEAIATIAP